MGSLLYNPAVMRVLSTMDSDTMAAIVSRDTAQNWRRISNAEKDDNSGLYGAEMSRTMWGTTAIWGFGMPIMRHVFDALANTLGKPLASMDVNTLLDVENPLYKNQVQYLRQWAKAAETTALAGKGKQVLQFLEQPRAKHCLEALQHAYQRLGGLRFALTAAVPSLLIGAGLPLWNHVSTRHKVAALKQKQQEQAKPPGLQTTTLGGASLPSSLARFTPPTLLSRQGLVAAKPLGFLPATSSGFNEAAGNGALPPVSRETLENKPSLASDTATYASWAPPPSGVSLHPTQRAYTPTSVSTTYATWAPPPAQAHSAISSFVNGSPLPPSAFTTATLNTASTNPFLSSATQPLTAPFTGSAETLVSKLGRPFGKLLQAVHVNERLANLIGIDALISVPRVVLGRKTEKTDPVTGVPLPPPEGLAAVMGSEQASWLVAEAMFVYMVYFGSQQLNNQLKTALGNVIPGFQNNAGVHGFEGAKELLDLPFQTFKGLHDKYVKPNSLPKLANDLKQGFEHLGLTTTSNHQAFAEQLHLPETVQALKHKLEQVLLPGKYEAGKNAVLDLAVDSGFLPVYRDGLLGGGKVLALNPTQAIAIADTLDAAPAAKGLNVVKEGLKGLVSHTSSITGDYDTLQAFLYRLNKLHTVANLPEGKGLPVIKELLTKSMVAKASCLAISLLATTALLGDGIPWAQRLVVKNIYHETPEDWTHATG